MGGLVAAQLSTHVGARPFPCAALAPPAEPAIVSPAVARATCERAAGPGDDLTPIQDRSAVEPKHRLTALRGTTYNEVTGTPAGPSPPSFCPDRAASRHRRVSWASHPAKANHPRLR